MGDSGAPQSVIFVMGVSGSGKSTVGKVLADDLGIPYFDADDFHTESNVEKMRSGIPLNDKDRMPWLSILNGIANRHQKVGCVIACSALKASYRTHLVHELQSSVFVFLSGSFDQIFERMQKRLGHYMKADMLRSQFEIVEKPQDAITVDISEPLEIIVNNIKQKLYMKSEIGLIGLGVMGKSLSRNLAQKGFKVSMYNRHVDGKEVNVAKDFKAAHVDLTDAQAFSLLDQFVTSMETPRKIILMVNAGQTVDYVLADLAKVLDSGDIVIDCGNSHFMDTSRRIESMKEQGFVFIGAGVSGGEEGALNGPSIMPSGDEGSYAKVEKYLTAIAAKDKDERPCCTYVGRGGSGHFVKMIHNGIEYAEMQLIAECYAILKHQDYDNEAIAAVFESWLMGQSSYLLSITVDILRKKIDGNYIIDQILDKAGNKGTGKWATSSIADSGQPTTMIPAALFARYLSYFKEKRVAAAKVFTAESQLTSIAKEDLQEAYRFSRIVNHHQGFELIERVSSLNGWNVDLSEIARIWTRGCIIKSDLMQDLVEVLKQGPSIMMHDNYISIVQGSRSSAQLVASLCIQNEIHAPCLIESVNYFHGLKTADSSASIIQAQRDYFGAHTYQKKEDDTCSSCHTEW